MSRKNFRYRMVPNMIRSPEDQFVLEPWRPFAGPFDLLNRYRDQSDRLRYRSLMVHFMSMDHMIPYLVFDRYIGG